MSTLNLLKNNMISALNPVENKLCLRSDPKSLLSLESWINSLCETYSISVELYGNILIALSEAVNNAIIHGNKNVVEKEALVDVAVQGLPVRFAIDRAGLVGADGATHAGVYDLAYLSCLPNMVIMCPSDEAELVHMVATAAAYDDGPSALRYPRGEGVGCAIPEAGELLEIGKGRILREGRDVAILSLGTRLGAASEAAYRLEGDGISVTIADARFAKPLDMDLIDQLAINHKALLIVEEGSPGGFAAHVMTYLGNAGHLDGGLKARALCLPDVFIDHDSQQGQLAFASVDCDGIYAAAHKVMPKPSTRTTSPKPEKTSSGKS